jgi:hypothetical protein
MKGNKTNSSAGEIVGNTLINIKREANRHFRNKKKEYLKGEINDICIKQYMNLKWATNLKVTQC